MMDIAKALSIRLEEYERRLEALGSLGLSFERSEYGSEFVDITDPKTGLSICRRSTAETIQLLEFLVQIGKLNTTTDEPGTAEVATSMQELERRVSALEKALQNDTSAQGDADYEHYLELFRQKRNEFATAGVELIIDAENRRVRFRNLGKSTNRAIYYKISQLGFKKACDALRHIQKTRNKKN